MQPGPAIFLCMKHTFLLLVAISLSFPLASCKSKEEQAREKALESQADSLESQADATKDAADAQAEALKKEAERAREQK